ncbi:23S rRNA (guanosine(2251)-2'-O)-methyltransferase RlmB [bacterium]|nr:23S rRNA (guanosine(2251)-2'-O)-methyltransferase RlmB [bacterium]
MSGRSSPSKRGKKSRERSPRDVVAVYGVRAVQEVLRWCPERARELLCTSERSTALQDQATALRIPVRRGEEEELAKLAHGVNHQGVALLLTPREPEPLERLVAEPAEQSLLLALDEISDPQNLGSLFRAAECFGARAILTSKNRGAGITPAVTKIAAGATELVPYCPVSNLRTALSALRKGGYWVCVTAVGGSATSLHDFSFPERCVCVLGSEGRGVQPLIQQEADFLIEIPMLGKIDSLNVSQAAAVLLASYRQQHHQTGVRHP